MKSLLDKVNAKLNAQGGFLKAISILVSGTVIAQIISILALPIITRLYDPSEFAIFAVYNSLLMTLMVASCLRLEIAIPVPESNIEAIHLVILSLLSSFLFSFLLIIIIWIFHTELILLLNQPKLSHLIWLVPLGTLSYGFYNALQYWATRKKQFKLIARTRIVQSIGGTSIQILMGVMGFSTIGLILGQIIRISTGIRKLTAYFLSEVIFIIKNIKIKELIVTFKKYDKYPKYSTFEALANSASVQLPVVIIAAVAVGSEAGYLMLAMQVMAIPMKFIGSAVSQVYLANASSKNNMGELSKYTKECIFQILKIGVIPLLLIAIFAPIIFPYIFGEEWKRAGDMVLWMLPWFFMQLITSPVSMSLHITGNQRIALILQIVGLLIRTGGLLVISLYSIHNMFEYYALSGFIFYLIYIFVVFKVISRSNSVAKN